MKKVRTLPHTQSNTFAALMVGYYAVGKTALLSRFARNDFDEDYTMTINSNSAIRLFHLEGQASIRLRLTDSVGSSFGRHLATSSCPECDAVLLVYDIANEESFYRLDKWMTQVRPQLKSSVLLALVGTHLDQPYRRKVTQEEALKWKKRNNISLFFEISSKTNQNISQLFQELTLTLLYLRAQNDFQIQKSLQMNPELSTLFSSEKQLPENISRITVLQKKLKFKEQECQKLWIDYEDTLRQLQISKGENNNIFYSSKEFEPDNDELENKVKHLEETIKVLQDFYTEKQATIQDSCCKKVQHFQNNIGQLTLQIEKHQKVAQSNQETIKDLSTKVNSLQLDLYQELDRNERMTNELQKLINRTHEKMPFLENQNDSENQKVFTFEHLNTLNLYLERLMEQLAEKDSKLLEKDYDIKLLILKKDEQQMVLKKLADQLRFQKQVQAGKLARNEQQFQYYREQVRQKQELEKMLEEFKQSLQALQKECDLKSQEYLEIIQQKEKNTRVLLANAKLLEMQLSCYKSQHQKLKQQNQEKDKLLENKQQIIDKLLLQKAKEIQTLKQYIQKGGNPNTFSFAPNRSDGKYEESESGQENGLRAFLSHFLEQLQGRSGDLLDALELIGGKVEHVVQNLGLLKQRIPQTVGSFKGDTMAQIMMRFQLVEAILKEANFGLGTILESSRQSMAKINYIRQTGVDNYIQQLASE